MLAQHKKALKWRHFWDCRWRMIKDSTGDSHRIAPSDTDGPGLEWRRSGGPRRSR